MFVNMILLRNLAAGVFAALDNSRNLTIYMEPGEFKLSQKMGKDFYWAHKDPKQQKQ